MRTGPGSAGKRRVTITVEETVGAAADAPVRTGPGSAGQGRGLKTIEWGQLWLPNAETKRIDARIAAEEAAEDVTASASSVM